MIAVGTGLKAVHKGLGHIELGGNGKRTVGELCLCAKEFVFQGAHAFTKAVAMNTYEFLVQKGLTDEEYVRDIVFYGNDVELAFATVLFELRLYLLVLLIIHHHIHHTSITAHQLPAYLPIAQMAGDENAACLVLHHIADKLGAIVLQLETFSEFRHHGHLIYNYLPEHVVGSVNASNTFQHAIP